MRRRTTIVYFAIAGAVGASIVVTANLLGTVGQLAWLTTLAPAGRQAALASGDPTSAATSAAPRPAPRITRSAGPTDVDDIDPAGDSPDEPPPSLVELLSHPDPDVRTEAAALLDAWRDEPSALGLPP